MKTGRLTGPRNVRPTKAVRAVARREMDRSGPRSSATCSASLLGVTKFYSSWHSRELYHNLESSSARSPFLATPLLFAAPLFLFRLLPPAFLAHHFQPLPAHAL